jgi:hypothetical protein
VRPGIYKKGHLARVYWSGPIPVTVDGGVRFTSKRHSRRFHGNESIEELVRFREEQLRAAAAEWADIREKRHRERVARRRERRAREVPMTTERVDRNIARFYRASDHRPLFSRVCWQAFDPAKGRRRRYAQRFPADAPDEVLKSFRDARERDGRRPDAQLRADAAVGRKVQTGGHRGALTLNPERTKVRLERERRVKEAARQRRSTHPDLSDREVAKQIARALRLSVNTVRKDLQARDDPPSHA